MRQIRSIAALAGAAALFLAACTEDGVSMAARPPAPAPAAAPATILPATEPQRISRTETTATTAVSADGRTTTTTASSTTVSFEPAALLAALGAAPAAPARAYTAADYAGPWNVSNARNPQCRFTLQAPVNAQPGWVSNMGCFGDPLFNVTRWSLRGTELVLTDGFARPLVSLRATGPNRLEGGGVTMWR